MARETEKPVVVGWIPDNLRGPVSPSYSGQDVGFSVMPIFRCTKCGCIENTACSNYWSQVTVHDGEKQEPLCSECDPEIGKWHNNFPKNPADGMVIASDGFLHHPNDIESDNFKFRMKHQGLKVVGTVPGELSLTGGDDDE